VQNTHQKSQTQKKAPVELGRETFLLSHIKDPLREEKREVANHSGANVAKLVAEFKGMK
jgi:hypothetical protein